MTEKKCNELLKLLQRFEDFFNGTLCTENRSSRLRIKIGCEAYIFETISSTKGTGINVKKGS